MKTRQISVIGPTIQPRNFLPIPALFLLFLSLFLLSTTPCFAGNIAQDSYAWAENVGWINFSPSQGDGVTVTSSAVTGYAWGENIGWINLSPATAGVTNDGCGHLSGWAWGENIGWISFSCENTGSCDTVRYGVRVDAATGAFSGTAWGENIGWIVFSDDAPVAYGVTTDWRNDTDGDGLCDDWEIANFTDMDQDGNTDFDEDGLIDIDEYHLGTDPTDADTDDDGILDGAEVNTNGTDPFNPDITAPAAPADLDLAAEDDTGEWDDDNFTSASPLTISGTGETGATIQLLDNGVPIAGATATVADGVFSITLSFADGIHPITAVQTDAAGNVSAPSSPALTLDVDVELPAAPGTPVLAAEDDTGETGDGATLNRSGLTFSGTATENDSLVRFYDYGVAIEGAVATVVAGAYTIDLDLDAGTHSITAKKEDLAGNISSNSSAAVALTIFPEAGIDPDAEGDIYAWAENVGWINFDPNTGPGVTVTDTAVTGFAWGENIGWINLSPATAGVTNDGSGHLAGYAWGENVGWISFSCTNTNSCGTVDYGVTIDKATGEFSGHAWGENIGWIVFSDDDPVAYGVTTAWRDTDTDGLIDRWEREHFGYIERDGTGDADNDGLTDAAEHDAGTDPNAVDTDGDGMPDKWEIDNGRDPLTDESSADLDGDGYPDSREYQDGTDWEDPLDFLAFSAPTGAVPDTGQTSSFTDTAGEDSDFSVNPPAFVKMDAAGNFLADVAPDWAMVLDTVTGLIWEVKTADGTIHDGADRYSWDAARGDFVAGLNSEPFGGIRAWRLPTAEELAHLVHRGAADPAAFAAYFPRTASEKYWTGTTCANSVMFAQTVDFDHGTTACWEKPDQLAVRAVYGSFPAAGALVDNNDGTATDPRTGLMWSTAAFGPMDWDAALGQGAAADLPLGSGYADWRLPTVNELLSVAGDPTLGTAPLWSSTADAAAPGSAWTVVMADGAVQEMNMAGTLGLHLVRGGQHQSGDAVAVTEPRQGAVWIAGTTAAVTWDALDLGGNVAIDLSVDGGQSFSSLAAAEANDGLYEWTVTGTDTPNAVIRITPDADSQKASSQGFFTIAASVSPQAEIFGAPDSVTADGTAVLTIGGAGVTAYKFQVDGGGYSTEIALSGGTYSDTAASADGEVLTLTLAAGAHTLDVLGKAADGTWQATATTAAWTVDDAAPTVTGLSDDPGPVNQKSWTWAADEPALFRYTVNQSAAWTPVGDFSEISGYTLEGVNGTWYVHVQAVDAAGHLSDVVTVSAPFDSQVAAPAGIDLAAEDDTGFSATDNLTGQDEDLTISGTGEAGSTVQIQDNGANIADAVGPVTDGAFAVDIALTHGVHEITAVLTDAAGNPSAPSWPALTITVDTQAPAAPAGLDLAAADDTNIDTDNLTTRTSALTLSGAGEPGARVQLYDDGAALGSVVTINGEGTFTLDVALAPGVHPITAVQTDPAGNASAASDPLTITVDTTAPAAPTGLDLAAEDDTGLSDTDNVTQITGGLTLCGAAVSGNTVRLYDGATLIGSGTAADSAFCIDVSLAHGSHSLTAVQIDGAGNPSPASASLTVTVDTAAPTPPGTPDLDAGDDTGASNSDNLTKNTADLTLHVAGENGAQVQLFSGTDPVGSPAVVSGGACAIAIDRAQGTYNITARQTDPAGNESEYSQILEITVDATLPTVSVESPSNNSSVMPLYAAAGEAGDNESGVDKVEVRVKNADNGLTLSDNVGGTWTAVDNWLVADGTGSWTLPFGGSVLFEEGKTYEVTARSIDRAGNQKTSPVTSFVYAESIYSSTISCNLSATERVMGQPFSVTGQIVPGTGATLNGTAKVVTVKFTRAADNTTVYRFKYAGGDGLFDYEIECGALPGAGTWTVETSWGGEGDIQGATSDGADTIALTAADSQVNLDVSSQIVKLGDALSISGKFTPAYDCGGGLKNIPITLTITDSQGNILDLEGDIVEGPDPVSPIEVVTYDNFGHFVLMDYAGLDHLGSYTVTADFAGNEAYNTSTSDSVQVTVVETAGYAIIVQGRILPSEEGLASHNKTTNHVYEKLKSRGLLDEDIFYLNFDTTQPKVDALPTRTALAEAITVWARDKMDPDFYNDAVPPEAQVTGKPANLYIVMVDHGNTNAFYMDNEVGDAPITPAELDGWLDDLQENLVGTDAENQEIVVVIGACYSGSFVPVVSGAHRVIVTSAAEDEVSYKGPLDGDTYVPPGASTAQPLRDGEYFVTEFFKQAELGKSVKDAFLAATGMTEKFTAMPGGSINSLVGRYLDSAMQHPILDDNGDGSGTNDLIDPDGDGQLAADLFIGVTPLSSNAPGDVQVTETAETVFLGEGDEYTADFWARVSNDTRLSSIWIEVKHPDFLVTGDDTGQRTLDLPKVFGVYDETTGRYQWPAIEGFDTPGTHQVFYFARDCYTGNVSPMKETRVYKALVGNSPPNPLTLVEPEDGASVRTDLLLDWTDTNDPNTDTITYTVLLSTGDDTFYDPIRIENIENSTVAVTDTHGLQDLTTYYWKVLAIDAYGAIRESEVRSFSTNNTNGARVNLWFYVVDSSTGMPINHASVTVGGLAFSPVTNYGNIGAYQRQVDSEDNNEIVISATGYQTFVDPHTQTIKFPPLPGGFWDVFYLTPKPTEVAKPLLTRASPRPLGPYFVPLTIGLECATPGATIRYTTNGNTPTTSSPSLGGNLTINNSTTLKAVAFKSGYTASDVFTASYTITGTVATPTFSPAPGSYTSAQSVTLSCADPADAEIRYTIDGSDPSTTSFLHSGPIFLSADTTLKARAFKSGWVNSAVATGVYSITTNAAPVIDEDASVNVTMDEDGSPAAFALTLNASDADGDTLTWSISDSAAHGTATAEGTGASKAIGYAPAANWNGTDSFEVQVSDGNGGSDTITVTVTVDARNDAPVNTAVPSITGTGHVGQVLTADAGTWNDDADQAPGTISYSYQWQVADDAQGSGLADIVGATASTYTLTAAENGKYVGVNVTATNTGEGLPETVSVAAISGYIEIANAAPVIDEGASVNVTMDEDGSPAAFALTLNASDADGDTLTWSISNAASYGTATAQGTGASKAIGYAPAADWNGTDSFEVQVSDGNGGIDAITVTVTVSPRNDAPVNTAAPSISGTGRVNEELTADAGTWNDDADQESGTITYVYQWQTADDGTGENLADIDGATGSTHTPAIVDAGRFIRVRVTATDNGVGEPARASAEAVSSFMAIVFVPEAGDVDGDTEVTLADAIVAMQITAGRPVATQVYLEADANGDGRIGIEEVLYIIQTISDQR
ncbi:MAG: DUF1566 domain-containing protein [Desulfobacterales bacterium]|nr:DUF1566 domain-containing protein [Desulfobacterales bacterium]